MTQDVQIAPDGEQLAERCAAHIVTRAQAAIDARGTFTFCAAGGNTPRGVYGRLASPELAKQVDWQRVEVFFGDERCVGPTEAQSNFRMLQESLLSHVPIPERSVYRIAGELDPNHAAHSYAQALRTTLGENEQGWPESVFDLVLLGLGTDGHTASLFPGSAPESRDWVSARQQPVTQQWRITLTEPVLSAAHEVIFLVAGADKAERLAEVVRGARDLARLPAQRIAPRGTLRFWVDQRAAAKL